MRAVQQPTMKSFFVALVAFVCLAAANPRDIADGSLEGPLALSGGPWQRAHAATPEFVHSNLVDHPVEVMLIDEGVDGVLEKDAELPVVNTNDLPLSGDEIAHQFYEEHIAEFEDIDDSVGFNGVDESQDDDDDTSPIPSPYDIPGYSYANTEEKLAALGINPKFVDNDILEDSFLLVVSLPGEMRADTGNLCLFLQYF